VSMKLTKDRRFFEWMLVAIVFGMGIVAYKMGGHKLVALNLFYLPIILCGYFLGRSSACILALLCALAVTIATALDPGTLAVYFTSLMGGLAMAVWAAVLALTAILLGTLCDERAKTVDDLHAAYVGVVEVLSKYLQGGHPKFKARSVRVAEMCQLVAEELKLSRKEIDDIRVGALLLDLGNVQITTKVITRAVDTLEQSPNAPDNHTFPGMDLVHSLGLVLHGAVPLLLNQDESLQDVRAMEDEVESGSCPLGAKIIRSVREYDTLAANGGPDSRSTSEHALNELRSDPLRRHDPNVLRALERVVRRGEAAHKSEPAYI